MYESPITKLMSEISSQMIKEDEDHLMYEVRKAVGYEIDKDELLRALRYDREQYRRGYNDGTREVLQHVELATKQLREEINEQIEHYIAIEDGNAEFGARYCLQIVDKYIKKVLEQE